MPTIFFTALEKSPDSYEIAKENSQSNPEQKRAFPDFKLYYKVMLTKTDMHSNEFTWKQT